MQHKLIKTDNYLLVVDDSEIKEGDYCTTHLNIIDVGKIHNSYTIFHTIAKEHLNDLKSCKKIIAHLPLNNAPILEGVDLLPPLEDDGDLIYENTEDSFYKKYDDALHYYSFIEGYNKAKEKYKYTEKDMLEFAIWRSTTVFTEPYTPLGEFILWESLQQQKYPVAFDLYMTHQRLGVTWKMSEIIKNNQSDLEEWKPKTITNSQGQTQLVGTYIYE